MEVRIWGGGERPEPQGQPLSPPPERWGGPPPWFARGPRGQGGYCLGASEGSASASRGGCWAGVRSDNSTIAELDRARIDVDQTAG
jgi:hypothetical protein